MQKENGESFSTFSVSVPRAGVEPAQVSLLVFETSASTDSAIWAASKTYSVSNCGAKVGIIFKTAKL